MALHYELYDGPDEWNDAIVFKIITPKELEGTNLTVYCLEKPDGHPMRQIGSRWSFKIEKKRIVEQLPGAEPGKINKYPASEGDLEDMHEIN